MLKGHHHRVDNLLDGDVDALLAQDRAIEVAVVDHDGVGSFNGLMQRLSPVRLVLRLPDVHRIVVFRNGDKHHLRLFGIAIRAVPDVDGAICFQIQPERAHDVTQ